MSRVTLQAIADHLGISKFAVSRALTGKSGVSEGTRRSVQEAAERFGYTARSKGKAAVRSIEVIFRDQYTSNRELWIDVQHGIEMEAMRGGQPIDIHWTDSAQDVRDLFDDALGFILVGPNTPEVLEATRDSPVPAVIVSHVVPPLFALDQITATDVEAGAYVAHFLADLGHRHMVYVHGQAGFPGRDARFRGMIEAIAGIEGAEYDDIVFAEDYSASGFREALLTMAERGVEPTAFFCGSDGVAVTVISELSRLGLRVPQDVSVIGHADYPIATQISPHLTTVHMPHRQMGVEAVKLLRTRLGPDGNPRKLPWQRICFVPHLVERQSTGPARPIDWRSRLSEMTRD